MKTRFKFILSVFIAILQIVTQTSCNDVNNRSPLLILATDDHFGTYSSEILRTEGFNEFELDSIGGANFSSAFLKKFDIVILAQSPVSQKQQNILISYVTDGGNLIAFKPDKKLSKLFGIVDIGGTISEGYISIDDGTSIGKGITTETLQFHGTADKYKMQGSKAMAALFTDPVTATGSPAVVMNEFGKGHAIAFLYNLPESIVMTRQGNYRNAGKEMDGITGIRAMDLFTDGWVNTSRNTLNQADEQMSLLSHCIEYMTSFSKPLPRFWYFPDSLHCLVTLNNDGEDSKEAEFTPQFEDVDAKGAKMTLYIKEPDFISAPWVDKWIKKGFEIAGHPDDTKQATAPDWNTMDSVIKDLKNKLKKKYGISDLHTNTNHWFVWVGNNANKTADFAALAKIEEINNIGLDCNYAHYDNGSRQGHFLGEMGTNQGNYTGSGLTMKFADVNGKIVNVYQQLNNVYDQQYMENKDQEGYYNAFKGLMDRSLEKDVYSYICVRAHNNEYYFSKVPLMKMLDYANSKNVPVWTELKLLDFLKAKDEAGFTDISWEKNRLTFKIRSSLTHSHGITFMVPGTYNGKKINKIISKGVEQHYRITSAKGYDYAMVTIRPGEVYEFEINYIN